MNRLPLLLFLFAAFWITTPLRVSAQTGPSVSNVRVEFIFGESIVITGTIDPAMDYEIASVQFEFPGDNRTLTAALEPDLNGRFTYTHAISDRFVQAFSEVSFRFVLEMGDGGLQTSEPYVFFYTDNRFEWQALEMAPFRVHWYEGSLSYAQQALDSAQEGYARAQAALQTGLPDVVDIYLYAGLADYQTARGQLGQLWAGGHADPASGLVLASVPPGDEADLEIERKIPHEMAHLALFQATGAGYWNLPAWLNEGFASTMETFPNPDFDFLVASAAARGELGSLASLCEVFPQDAGGAALAYAQATSAVRYVESAYGSAGLQGLVEAYAGGAGCSQGTLAEPIGKDLSVLEAGWLKTLGDDPVEEDQTGFLIQPDVYPWLFVFAAVLLGPLLVLAGSGRRKGGLRGG